MVMSRRAMLFLTVFLGVALVVGACAPAPTVTPLTPTEAAPRSTVAAPAAALTPTLAAPGPTAPAPTPTSGPRPTVAAPTATRAAPAPTAVQPKYGGNLRVSGSEIISFDPQIAQSNTDHSAFSLVYGKLAKYGYGTKHEIGDFNPYPDMAERWENPTTTTFIFYLRKGIKFHNKPPVNGRELKAADVKYTYERIRALAPYKDYVLGSVASIETPDDYTVKFVLKEPSASFMVSAAAYHFLWILPKEVEAQYGDFKRWETAIGTGPWMLERYSIGDRLVFQKNPDYFLKGLPYIDKVERFTISDVQTTLAGLRTGRLDIAGVDTQAAADLARTNPSIMQIKYQRVSGRYYSFDTTKPPFSDVRVRRAVALGVDQKAWLTYHKGNAYLQGPLRIGLVPWSLPVEQLGPGARYLLEYNPTEAKRLLAEAGYPKGFSTKFWAHQGSCCEEHELAMSWLKGIGITPIFQQQEQSAYIRTTYLSNYDEGMGWNLNRVYFDPDQLLWDMYIPGEPLNHSKVNDPKLTELVKEQRRTLDTTRRKAIMDEIQRYAADMVYYLHTPQPYSIAAFQPRLKGYVPTSAYDVGLTYLEAWLAE